LPDWINTDTTPSATAEYLDFTKPFPFADNIFAAVFCEHTIEHVSKAQAFGMIAEVFRVLRPEGLFRIVTPSLENFAGMALEPKSPSVENYLAWFQRYNNNPRATVADAINLTFYGHGHQHIYMADELLAEAGFTMFRTMPPGAYGHEIFNGADGHGRVIGSDINAMEAFAAEAAKPRPE
jgi:SAM-dependent methyltransferase